MPDVKHTDYDCSDTYCHPDEVPWELTGPAPGIELPCKPTLIFAAAFDTLIKDDEIFSGLAHILAHDLVYSSTSTFMQGHPEEIRLQIVQNFDRETLWKAAREHQGSHIYTGAALKEGGRKYCKPRLNYDKLSDREQIKSLKTGASGILNGIEEALDKGDISYQAVILNACLFGGYSDGGLELHLNHLPAFLHKLHEVHHVNVVIMGKETRYSEDETRQGLKRVLPSRWEFVPNNSEGPPMTPTWSDCTPVTLSWSGKRILGFGSWKLAALWDHSPWDTPPFRAHSPIEEEMLESFYGLFEKDGLVKRKDQQSGIMCSVGDSPASISFFGYHPGISNIRFKFFLCCNSAALFRLCYADAYKKHAQCVALARIEENPDEHVAIISHLQQAIDLLNRQGAWSAVFANMVQRALDFYKYHAFPETRDDLLTNLMEVDESRSAKEKISQAANQIIDYLVASGSLSPLVAQWYRSRIYAKPFSNLLGDLIDELEQDVNVYWEGDEETTYLLEQFYAWELENGVDAYTLKKQYWELSRSWHGLSIHTKEEIELLRDDEF